MMAQGLLDEVLALKRSFVDAGVMPSAFDKGLLQAIGVREFWDLVGVPVTPGQLTAATDAMKRSTRRYARQQARWIRNRLEKGGVRMQRLVLGDLARWSQDVFEPAVVAVRAFLS
jgi:tRNA A37 N6-isopentenylltransferase MiaA